MPDREQMERQLARMRGFIENAEENGQFDTVWHDIAADLEARLAALDEPEINDDEVMNDGRT